MAAVARLGCEHNLRLQRVGRLRMLDVPESRRQEEGEGAALTEAALDVDLAPEQARDLPADREAEARAAVLATGRAVGLLEYGFEISPSGDASFLRLRNVVWHAAASAPAAF